MVLERARARRLGEEIKRFADLVWMENLAYGYQATKLKYMLHKIILKKYKTNISIIYFQIFK